MEGGVNGLTTLSVKLTFYMPNTHSLKEKRMIARSLIDKTRRKFSVSVAEVDTQDVHKTLSIGVAVVSGTFSHADTMLDDVIRYMQDNTDAELQSIEKH